MAEASRRVTEATNELTEAQQRAAAAHREVAAGAEAATRAEDQLLLAADLSNGFARSRITQAAADEESALQRGYAAIARISRAHEAARQRSHGGASHTAGAEDDKTAKTAEMAADEARRERELAQMRADRELSTEILRVERERAQVAREVADSWAEQVTHSEEYARIQARSRGLEQESVVASEVRILRARAAGQRGESAIGQRAELEDARDPAVQRERIDEMRRAHTLERERAHLTQRYEMQRSYVDRMEELNEREVNGNEALATSITSAFRTTGDALSAHLQAFADGRETAAEAMQNMLADTLKNIGKESLVKAGFYFATGLGNLAMLNFPGAATAFAASAAFAAIGGGLIAGGNALTDTNTLGARKDAEAKSAESSSRESAARVSGSRGASESAGTVYNITFGGPMYGTGGVRQAARQMVGAINRGGIQGGIQILPGALLGGGAGS
jgi:hypothetical protein